MTNVNGKKIKVAFLLAPITFGGAERVSMTLLRSIDLNKFEVVPLVLIQPWEKPNAFALELKKFGFECREIPVALQLTGDYLRVARCWKLVWRELRGGQYHLLHTNGYFADIVGLPVARILGLPSVSTCHGFISNNLRWRLYNAVNRLALRFATRILAVSEEIRKDLVRFGIGASKIRVIVNAVAVAEETDMNRHGRQALLTRCGITEKDFVVGFVGRLSDEKGLTFLLDATAILVKLGVNVKTLLVGDGPQKVKLKELSSKLQIDGRVVFAGFQENIVEWLACMDVFALPSLTEGTPMALLEAMANGVPTVASAVGGIPKLIEHDRTGFMFLPGRANEIADTIYFLYRNKHKRREMAINARNHIRKSYGIDNWIRSIEEEYQQLSIGGA